MHERLLAARYWYLRYNDAFKESIQRVIASGRLHMVGNHLVGNPAGVALLRRRLNALDQEREAVNYIVENLPLICVEPDEALRNRPWFSDDHSTWPPRGRYSRL